MVADHLEAAFRRLTSGSRFATLEGTTGGIDMSLRTVCYDWHVSHGGHMVDFAGWQMPVRYSTVVEEHSAVRNTAGLFDIGHMGRLRFDGPDACALLDRICTNDVSRLKVGDVRYSLVCEDDGGILDDVLIYRLSDHYALVVNASNRDKIVQWIGIRANGFDCRMRDETLETFMFAVQGPKSAALIDNLVAAATVDMKYYSVVETDVCGAPGFVSRTGYTGEDGFEIIVPNDVGVKSWEKLLSATAVAGARPCGLGARDTLRLEAAMPLYGHELDETIDPFTAGLAFAVKLQKKAEFIGRDALSRIAAKPLARSRVGLRLDTPRIPREKMPVLQQGEPVGIVTSGTRSPTMGASIAMAYVPTPLSAPGTVLQVDIRGSHELASVVSLPFYRRA